MKSGRSLILLGENLVGPPFISARNSNRSKKWKARGGMLDECASGPLSSCLILGLYRGNDQGRLSSTGQFRRKPGETKGGSIHALRVGKGALDAAWILGT